MKKMNLERRVLTVTEISEALIVNAETVRKWIKEKEIEGVSLGSNKDGMIILEDDFNAFLNKHSRLRKRYKTYAMAQKAIGNDYKFISIKELIQKKVYGRISYKDYCNLIITMDKKITEKRLLTIGKECGIDKLLTTLIKVSKK